MTNPIFLLITSILKPLKGSWYRIFVKVKVLASQSCLFATPWTIDHQVPKSMEFSRQGYFSQVAIYYSRGSSSPRDWTYVSCIGGRFFITEPPREPHIYVYLLLFSCSVVADSLWPHRLQHTGLPCLSSSHGVCSNSYPFSQWCHPTISYSVVPFSYCLQSFPAPTFNLQ